ncbi:CCR4-NOT transcription complex subunit 4 [Homalodisca vitripennis]|nr:CCR4-NOT transcription complex subunit 4 [Homalodisca vitripennis]
MRYPGPSASAYVTYQRADDALRAIQSVNNIMVDGRTVKTSLGTTKYCSHFMKNQTCPKGDCMYLHDLVKEACRQTGQPLLHRRFYFFIIGMTLPRQMRLQVQKQMVVARRKIGTVWRMVQLFLAK